MICPNVFKQQKQVKTTNRPTFVLMQYVHQGNQHKGKRRKKSGLHQQILTPGRDDQNIFIWKSVKEW